ncbi:TRP-domain-containing protein [Piedraia hortae CBS 480.64]|uniref:TRP-domain-containing protein n=1 Tax=Piedraia hortae CBS 480.64 TaxID=1314780 RepID=A0A6A7BWT0_9PEZI|nr:TRP-domain-containing protein [Piedraia hortae CBS 480.64]
MLSAMLSAVIAVLMAVGFVGPVEAAAPKEQIITYQGPSGQPVYLRDDRQPALFTGNFGDCLGNSLINVTRFDAAYYKDNMTVLFHLEGNSGLANESLMMFIGVYAYGENRFDLTFNPCNANINSLCPLNRSVPVEAAGIIPVAPADVANIPPIALSIPDFEGEAILRIFANSTQSEIGCYSAVITNGNSFGQPKAGGTILGVFTLVTLLTSFATAIYGDSVPTMRLHYAHSLSVGLVIAVFQHIYFSGALSVNWPSVLVAWWSNFAWAGGMIHSSSMQSSINRLIGNNVGNTSQVGAASAGSTQESLGGGYDISKIYKRAVDLGLKPFSSHPIARDVATEIYRVPDEIFSKRHIYQRDLTHAIARRGLANSSTGYTFYGHPVGNGLPLPGNYSGFAGTLAPLDIGASNAFMTGFLWLLILFAILVGAIVAFKFALEGLAGAKMIKQDRLRFFRQHWVQYTVALALRTWYLALFMMMFLTIFQFTYSSSGAVKGIAAIVFALYLVGAAAAAAFACLAKSHSDVAHGGKRKGNGLFSFGKKAAAPMDSENGRAADKLQDNIHDNEKYIMKYGWLMARLRRSRWWFFNFWIPYELLRAIFYGGASGYPIAQVFGLLAIETVAFIYLIWKRPFESRRLNVLVVYCLGFSKFASVALSAAFYTPFSLPRITTTVIGIVIIVIQGVLTIITMIAVVSGAVSSYLSLTRNVENFRPKGWVDMREKYFDHLDRVADDLPRSPKQKKPKAETPQEVKEGFEMKSVRRMDKIEDGDEEDWPQDPSTSSVHLIKPEPAKSADHQQARAPSLRSVSSNLPYGARLHKPSWSTKDFVSPGTSLYERDNTPSSSAVTSPRDSTIGPPVRSVTLPASQLRTSLIDASSSTLNFGGLSTRDTIGIVPAPTIRPRSGTMPSIRSPPPDDVAERQDSQRLRGRTLLTPALEQDELSRPSSRQQ